MIPTMQTILSKSDECVKGDCLRACICSLLHLPIEEVPHFIEYKPDRKWFDFMKEWLNGVGYELKFDCEPPDVEYYMVWGKSPRGIQHSVIYSRGELVHDPHPEGGGVIPEHYVWLEEMESNLDIELFDAKEDCKHVIVSAPPGGVVCLKCKGWHCY